MGGKGEKKKGKIGAFPRARTHVQKVMLGPGYVETGINTKKIAPRLLWNTSKYMRRLYAPERLESVQIFAHLLYHQTITGWATV